jgi:hypothetical protein
VDRAWKLAYLILEELILEELILWMMGLED